MQTNPTLVYNIRCVFLCIFTIFLFIVDKSRRRLYNLYIHKYALSSVFYQFFDIGKCKMKFTHYDYKCIYFVPSEDPNIRFDEKYFIASNRSEINLDLEYHCSSICIYSEDKKIEKFSLGLDFSPPGSLLSNRCQDRLFLNFIIRGKGRVNGEPFSAGQFYYTLPLQNHTVETDSDEPFVSAWMSIDGTYAYDIIKELNKISTNHIMSFYHRSDVMKLTKTLIYETNLGEMSTEYLHTVIGLYLGHLERSAAPEAHESFESKKTAQLVRESKIYVRKNLKHVTVSEMAAALHYNTNYFSRVFAKAMGMTPLEYITDCKMEWAKNSLIHSNLTIEEIMEAIGYDHRNGFTIAFKKKYGAPPAAFRRKTKNQISHYN